MVPRGASKGHSPRDPYSSEVLCTSFDSILNRVLYKLDSEVPFLGQPKGHRVDFQLVRLLVRFLGQESTTCRNTESTCASLLGLQFISKGWQVKRENSVAVNRRARKKPANSNW